MAAEPRLTRAATDSCLYYLLSDDLTIYVVSNVDDYAVFCSDESWYAGFQERYSATGTELVDEGPLSRWCGQDIKIEEDGSVTLSQEFDVLSAIAEFPGISDMRPVDTPMETNFLGVAKTKVADTDTGGVMERDAEFPYRGAIGHASTLT